MRKTFLTIAFAALVGGVCAQQKTGLPYQNPLLTADERADDLISRLTLEEKAKLMMNESPAIERLGIPQFEWWNEALHGIGRNGYATVFPITTAMAASWNDPLLQRIFDAASDEARVKSQQAKRSGNIRRYQGLSFWTPNINIFRDPRWGRGQETYGEDPYLTGKMGMAVVRGLQGPDAENGYYKLLACAKHFAVHSGPEWNRHSFNILDLPARDLWETYLPAFRALVQDAGVAEVMCAYQRIDGEPCCGNTKYEQQILRDEWGFEGLITSDCWAINDFFNKGAHEVSSDPAQAVGKAVRAGTDVECGQSYFSLPEAVRRGDVTEAEVDRSLKRLLVARFRLGDFDSDELVKWTRIPESCVASKEHKQLALDMARQSIVLLQNNNNILPLSIDDDIVVMGPNANDSVMQWGNYNGFPTATTTILQGIRQKTGRDVRYIPGCGLTRKEVSESLFGAITCDGRHGMRATYWNNTGMRGTPVATSLFSVPVNQSNGGATVFAPGVNLENFSARYEGTVSFDKDMTLSINISCDDRMTLFINGKVVATAAKEGKKVMNMQKKFTFKKGRKYDIAVDYVQLDGSATFRFDMIHTYTPTGKMILNEVGKASTVVFVGGISPRVEGEEMRVDEPGFRGGDRTDIELPAVQRQLISMLRANGKKVIMVNCSGGAVGLEPESRNCEALLQAWYGGEKGGEAVADVLYGDYNPSGKLPLTFYKNVSQLPDFEDYRMAGRTYRYFRGEPQWCFGHGLSYTSFCVENPRYNKAMGKLTVTVENMGKRDGDEVVQVYIHRPADVDGPLKTLRAYKRVSLKAGERRDVVIDLPRERFETWDAATNTMRVVSGRHEIMVGSDSNAANAIDVEL